MSTSAQCMLVVERGVSGMRVIPLDQPAVLLGASPSADIFLENPYVSRMHAQIMDDGGHYLIRDLESKNGTFVNGVRISSELKLLQNGDRIDLAEGQVVLRFMRRGDTVTLPVGTPPDTGTLVVDTKSREVWLQGKKIDSPLSRKEFDILALMYQKKGEACSKDEIADAGWPERPSGDVTDQEIEQSIRRIRLRIEPDPSRPRYIFTVRGFGYKLVSD